MRIKSRLQLNVVFSLAMALLIGVLLLVTIQRINRALEAAALTDQLMQSLFERSTFREDYLRTNSERAKVQWLSRQEEIGRLLNAATAKFRDSDGATTVAELLRSHETAGKLFAAIVKNRERNRTAAPGLAQEVENRLLTQLSLRLYDDTLHMGTLQAVGKGLVLTALKQSSAGIVVILAIILAAVVISSWSMNQTISRRVRRLCSGAAQIGQGDLEHRIAIQGDDEFVELAEAFNAMTVTVRDSYRDLQTEIEERKRAEVELLRAKEAAEDATRAKSQFLANMSHELRTPMTGVLGMIELTLGTGLDAKQRDYLDLAKTSADSLLRIINDILDLTKIEAGMVTIEQEPFILSACVADAIHLLTPQARRKGLQIQPLIANNLQDLVIGDQLRLRQILINLIGNAVKFTDQGQVDVRVAAGNPATDGQCEFHFTIIDTGIGIPAEKQYLLFRNFSQVDDSDSRRFGGTGLGLVISRELIELMGGTISFRSEAGEGSTFAFTIRLRVSGAKDYAPDASESRLTETEPAATPHEKKARILIAEDDAIIRQMLKLIFPLPRYELDFAEDGQEAVEKWTAGEYQLVLMDVQMPRLTGYEATRAIREQEQTRGGHTPIMALTANAFKEDEEKCLAAGMDAYLSKPIDFKKCLQMVEKILAPSSDHAG